ncbi:MAG TPA: MbtH family NRPS accessory protein [Streptosporangiaceae bacterium]
MPADENDAYLVVLNNEEQYSIWRKERELPAGWRAEGTQGTRAECLAHIDVMWTDMRPLSLRQRMDGSNSV